MNELMLDDIFMSKRVSPRNCIQRNRYHLPVLTVVQAHAVSSAVQSKKKKRQQTTLHNIGQSTSTIIEKSAGKYCSIAIKRFYKIKEVQFFSRDMESPLNSQLFTTPP